MKIKNSIDTLHDSEPAVNNSNDKKQHREFAALIEAVGMELCKFTLGRPGEDKIIASYNDTYAHTSPLGPRDWFGFWPSGDYAVLDVDAHSGEKEGYEALERLEKVLGVLLKLSAYCITPRDGLHILLKFPKGVLGNRKYDTAIYGSPLEFFADKGKKIILPFTERNDGIYRLTLDAQLSISDGRLPCVELDTIQAHRLLEIASQKSDSTNKTLEPWKQPHAWRDSAQWQPGRRNDMLFFWGVQLWGKSDRAKADITALIKMATEAKLDKGEIEKTLESASEAWKKRFDGLDCEHLYIPHSKFVDSKGDYRGEDGRIMLYVLEDLMGLTVRYNPRTARFEALHEGFAGLDAWTPIDDFLEARLKHLLRDKVHIGYDPPHIVDGEEKEQWKRYKGLSFVGNYLQSFYGADAVDPFKEWLEALPPWDEKRRLDSTLATCFDISENKHPEFAEWCFRSVLLGAVARTYHPGFKHDTVTVLVGPQGVGKSTFWRELIPLDSWFSDNIELGGSVQRRVESVLGCVLVECSEMKASRRADLEDIKAFVTRQRDVVRLAYAKNVSELRRRFVIVASTNSDTCLPNDPTGNRRFLPVEVKPHGGENDAGRIREYLSKNRIQLWSEALHRYHAGEKNYLSKKQERIQAEVNELHRPANELLENYLAKVETDLRAQFNNGERSEGWTLNEIQRELGLVSQMSEIPGRAVGHYLQIQGWRKKRQMIKNVRQVFWVPPIRI